MPKKSMRSRSRSRRGGFEWGSPSSWFVSKEEEQQPTYTPTTYTPTANTGYSMGGKKGKRRRSMRGGDYSDNISLNNLAANAAPFSNGNTATAPYVGGRTRRHRHTKSCKKSCRKYHRHNKSCKKSCRKH